MDDNEAQFREQMQRLENFRKGRPAAIKDGTDALKRLMRVAQSDTGQSKRVAHFLLGLFNGDRFAFDLTDFRGLDLQLFDDCMKVLRMDYSPELEVHKYFDDGGELFERLARDWGVEDRLARERD